ncbi:sigma-70 family RNA polymerase sigma factor [Acutalibacter sp. 1XD8-33]|uniref:sigma-70 family RNA polymerase sigma factor n=1 Tax=Acutalibacter sp. 1XD8-33 TaxID=2320081 RepID=UPI002430092E|nr:sigma-70 family RNA polymerase sigma factor [Acutalibacter sp. 1XD8-33]
MTENMGLVHLCARRFLGKGIEYDDLFQAGCVGLVKAAENFDPARGVKFSTYAVPVILGEVRRLFRDGGSVRVSRGLRELAQRVREAAVRLREESGQAPTIEQIAGALEITTEKAALAMGALRQPLSLTGGEEGEQLEIPVEAPEERTTERLTLYAIIQNMEERDRQLIFCRYFRSMTQTQTAKLLGMTQVQVSRREKKLLAYMRGEFEK